MKIKEGEAMNEEIKHYLQTVILKKNERIGNVEERDGLYIVSVIVQTPRTYRKVAQITIAQRTSSEKTIPQAIKNHGFTIRAKRELKEPFEIIFTWLQAGWIVREIRFNKDGLTVQDDFYRRGPTYHHIELKQQLKVEEDYENRLHEALQKVKTLQMPQSFCQATSFENMPPSWGREKKLQFIHFCIAFYQLTQMKDLFDFKEIGATYENRIGGSKIFDSYRDDFLTYLKDLHIDVQYYGLVSIGSIVPIYFTGEITSDLATYEIGTVHATTDDTVLKSRFTTRYKRLWLVENRAILTRMALEVEFLRETSSVIVCLDGQIKSAHKRFIKQLLRSSIERAYVWTDYDRAGVTIAKHAVELLTCPYKIIGRDNDTFTSIDKYEQSVLSKGKHEQEQQLGGVRQWLKWI